ncbi:uncharacterized protein LOC125033316 [Penaeus chinensis]|uniref:uncharacterized protein LOC125033316 n=1 Tax=Penaeus chinensis TaxID=139456 RepID=UPI001FB73979|nr:uncharacterized protein LOC125033316 [Penaeus chinensis]XP_047480666.1 uncharacterized protein LOC125033316 [Penaeus chinensis]
MDSTQAAVSSGSMNLLSPSPGPGEGERRGEQQMPLGCADGQGTARRESSEPGKEPAPSERDEPQTTSLPSFGYLNSTAWGTIEDDIHLDEHFLVFGDTLQVIPSAGAEVVYYWDRNPTGVRDPNTGLEF